MAQHVRLHFRYQMEATAWRLERSRLAPRLKVARLLVCKTTDAAISAKQRIMMEAALYSASEEA
jgi:hypothetical protein